MAGWPEGTTATIGVGNHPPYSLDPINSVSVEPVDAMMAFAASVNGNGWPQSYGWSVLIRQPGAEVLEWQGDSEPCPMPAG